MQKISLDALAREHLKRARPAPSGRSAQTVDGGHEHVLRQALMTLVKGRSLAEHENPGEATVLVLPGRVRLTAGADVWQAREGDLLIVPGARHNLEAVEDSAVRLLGLELRELLTGRQPFLAGSGPVLGHHLLPSGRGLIDLVGVGSSDVVEAAIDGDDPVGACGAMARSAIALVA